MIAGNDHVFTETEGENLTLTKREYFSIKLLQGIVATDVEEFDVSNAVRAVKLADILIDTLNSNDADDEEASTYRENFYSPDLGNDKPRTYYKFDGGSV